MRLLNKTDMHHHFIPPFYRESIIQRTKITKMNKDITPENSIKYMDSNNIKEVYLSIPAPGINFCNAEETINMARSCNEYAALLKEKFPERYKAFAVLPYPDVTASLDELNFALDFLKLDGVILYTDFYGELNNKEHYKPLFDELNRRECLVFIHPKHKMGNALNTVSIDEHLETTRLITKLLYEGILEKYMNIKYVLAHGGGLVPFYSQRLSRVHYLNGHRLRWFKIIKDLMHKRNSGLEILQNLYYECSEVMDNCFISSLLELVEPSHILYGSNWGEIFQKDNQLQSHNLKTDNFVDLLAMAQK